MKSRIKETKERAAQDPIMQQVVNDLRPPYALRDQVKRLDDSNMLSKSPIPSVVLDEVRDTLKAGLTIVSTYKDKRYTVDGSSMSYKGAIETLIVLLKFLKEYLPSAQPQG